MGYEFSRLGQGAGGALRFAREVMAPIYSGRAFVMIALTAAAVLLLRSSPLMDIPLEFAYIECEAVWQESDMLRQSRAGQAEWNVFAEGAVAKLQLLACELEKPQERPAGIWDLIVEPSEAVKEARHDLIQLTRNELPAAISGGPEGAMSRSARVQLLLDRLRDYMEGNNPYALAEVPGLEEELAPAWMLALTGSTIAVAVASGVVVLRWQRKRLWSLAGLELPTKS